MNYRLIHSDVLEGLRLLPDCSVDSVVTDPPYGLEFMGKEWDGADGFRRSLNATDAGRESVHGRTSRTSPEYRTAGTGRKGAPGIGKRETEWVSNQGWNQFRCAACGHLFHGGSPCRCETPQPVRSDNRWPVFQEWCEAWARECLRVLKPGGHLIAFGGSRTYHRLACAVEDAGFEVRDQLQWIYGSGFPKSLNVVKALECAQHLEHSAALGHVADYCPECEQPFKSSDNDWSGWGTALKPAHEPCVLARKPLSGTVAANVQTHGTGALNIDGCRIDGEKPHRETVNGQDNGWNGGGAWKSSGVGSGMSSEGRWPANVLLDEEAAAILDEQYGELTSGTKLASHARRVAKIGGGHVYSGGLMGGPEADILGSSGGASRFFYTAKAARSERDEGGDSGSNHHPTVKPVDLMRWLVRLVTPPGGTVLDPFVGSGSTGMAALAESFDFIGIEREAEYVDIARRRIRSVVPLFSSEVS